MAVGESPSRDRPGSDVTVRTRLDRRPPPASPRDAQARAPARWPGGRVSHENPIPRDRFRQEQTMIDERSVDHEPVGAAQRDDARLCLERLALISDDRSRLSPRQELDILALAGADP